MPLAGKPIVQNIVERVQRSSKLHEVVVSVPSQDLVKLATACGWSTVHAPNVEEDDVVGRYLATAQEFGADIICRIPCDNPLVDPEYIDMAIDSYLTELHPFYSNTTAWCGARYVDGIGCEVISMSRLKWLDRRTQGYPDWREHPHKWFVDSGVLKLPKADVRLDINTREDYEFIRSIYDHFGHNRFTTAEVLDYLYAAQPR